MTATLDHVATEPATVVATRETATPTGRRWLGLFAILAAMIMNLLDSTVVNVAAPSIRTELGGSYASLQWIAAGYTLALAVVLLTGGRLGDMFGRRRMLLIGAAGFVITSAACGFAFSPETLLLARVLQGAFAAVMIPQCFGLVRDLFPPNEIGKAFAAFGPVIGGSTILGPIVAGLLIDADLLGSGWRMIFLLNLPLGAFVMIAGARALPAAPATTAKRPTRLDLPGTLLTAIGMFLLVFPLVQGRELGWPTWSLAMLGGSLPVMVLFVAYQIRRKRAGGVPLIEMSVFHKRSYTSGVIFVIAFFGSIVGFSLAIGLFLQLGLGHSPIRASLTMAGWAVGAFLGSGFAAGMMNKLGRKILHLGLALMAAGIAGLYVVFQHSGIELGSWSLTPPLLVFGVGMGMIFVPLFDIIMGDIEDHEVGSAASSLEAIQQLGASLGVAILGTVFFGVIGAQAEHNFDTTSAPALRAELATAGVPQTDRERILTGLRDCLSDRENSTDPDHRPASCDIAEQPTDPAIGKAIAKAGIDTHKRDSLDAAKLVTLLTLGLIAVTFVIGFMLPKKARATH